MRIRRWLVVLVVAPALLLGACGEECEHCDADCQPCDSAALSGSGNVVVQEMDFAGFTSVEAANAFRVEITQAESFSVSVRVDDNLLDRVDVSKSDETLSIRLDPGLSLTGDVTLEATITMPDLEGLELSGASVAVISGFRSSGQLDILLSGASRVEGDVEAGEVEIGASGASTAALEGSAASLTIDGSGASSFDLDGLTVDTAAVELNGASSATVNARERIDPVKLSGASHLRYVGEPSLGDVQTSGSSTLEKVEN